MLAILSELIGPCDIGKVAAKDSSNAGSDLHQAGEANAQEADVTSRERFVNVLTGKPADRVPFVKVFGGTNAIKPHWEEEHPGIGQCIDELLRFEGTYRGWGITPVNMTRSWSGGAKEPAVRGPILTCETFDTDRGLKTQKTDPGISHTHCN